MQFRFSPLPCTTVKQQKRFCLYSQCSHLPGKPLDILPLEVDAQKVWTPLRKSGGIPYVSMRFSLSMEMSRLTRDGTAEPVSHDQIFPFQLTTCRIGNLTRLIHTLALCDDHTYILFKKNLNASKPSEHPPQVEECLKV